MNRKDAKIAKEFIFYRIGTPVKQKETGFTGQANDSINHSIIEIGHHALYSVFHQADIPIQQETKMNLRYLQIINFAILASSRLNSVGQLDTYVTVFTN